MPTCPASHHLAALPQYANELTCGTYDCSHNKGLISRFLLGSTSDYCSKHSTQPVVITH